MTFASRLSQVRQRMADAVARRGAGPDVRLIGVSKRHPQHRIREAIDAGLLDFGENYAQELRDKRAEIKDPVRWHFIGPIQTNKVKYLGGVHRIHTIDRAKLLDALEVRGRNPDVGGVASVLIQVNVAHETGKSGAAVHEVPALLDRFADLDHVRCDGLMLIPPAGDPESSRVHFRALRTLAETLRRTTRPSVELRELSMGMSHDVEVAIEEGATTVRVGTALFGPRPTST